MTKLEIHRKQSVESLYSILSSLCLAHEVIRWQIVDEHNASTFILVVEYKF